MPHTHPTLLTVHWDIAAAAKKGRTRMTKIVVTREYFALKVLYEINGIKYLYEQHLKGAIDAVKNKYSITTEDEIGLEEYIASIIQNYGSKEETEWQIYK